MDQQEWDMQRAKEQAANLGQAQVAGSPTPVVPTAAMLLEKIDARRDQLLKELATIELAAENLRKMPELAQLYEAVVNIQYQFGIR